jgi:hypothetical protein
MAHRKKTRDAASSGPATAQPMGRSDACHQVALALTGLVLGLSLLKFGNPVIFEGKLPPPATFQELIYFNWPLQWAWVLGALVVALLLPLLRIPAGLPKWLLIAPLGWLAWQWVACADSIEPALSRLTAVHFTVAVAWFGLGVLATRGVFQSLVVWIGLGIGFCLVISAGFQQQFGGLDETRVFYEKLARGEHPPEVQAHFNRPEIRQLWESPSFQLKVNSRRIYSTLFYPNTLAGVILLLTPGLLAAAWCAFRDASPLTRRLLPGLLLFGAALCLVWSGSKAGWLIALVQVGWMILRSSIPPKWKRAIIVSVMILGLTALVVRNLDYFQRGATSVSARTDYWASAWQTFREHPLTGTGPGTFGESYRARKAAESEMARLAHNDFIQQASDSGAIGFAGFLAFVGGAAFWIWRRLGANGSPLALMIGLGLVGWLLQSLTEFGLYIPAIVWPAFFLLGVLCREAANPIDTPPSGGLTSASNESALP